jgi:hypothetical protein
MFEGSERKIDHMPLVDLHELQNSQSPSNTFTRNLKQFRSFTPSWDKCYVELSSAISAASLVYAFGVTYTLGNE